MREWLASPQSLSQRIGNRSTSSPGFTVPATAKLCPLGPRSPANAKRAPRTLNPFSSLRNLLRTTVFCVWPSSQDGSDLFCFLIFGERMAKRMILTLVTLAALIGGLGFAKFKQVEAAIAQGASFQPPPTAVTTVVAEKETWPSTLSVIGTA